MGRERSASDLLFLASLGVLEAGCPGDDGTTADDAASTSAGTSGGTTAGASTSEASSTSGLTGSSTSSSGSSSGSSGADGTSGTTGEPECGEFPGKVGAVGEGCLGYVAIQELCLGERPLSPECLAYEQAVCQYQIDYSVMAYGEACGTAYEELFVCLSQLTCEEFSGDAPCPDEVAALMASCM